ncbi:hypothetical protein KC323_g171 [Hortaea werneckii]|nr:hypothetical protein KC323_g171 [Hortaea werneckii]
METTNELLMPEFLKKDVPYCAKMKLTPSGDETPSLFLRLLTSYSWFAVISASSSTSAGCSTSSLLSVDNDFAALSILPRLIHIRGVWRVIKLPVSMRSAVEWSTIAARRRPIGPSQIASKETTGDKEWNIDSSGLKDDTESEDQRRDHETQATTKEISSRCGSQCTKESTGREQRHNLRGLRRCDGELAILFVPCRESVKPVSHGENTANGSSIIAKEDATECNEEADLSLIQAP